MELLGFLEEPLDASGLECLIRGLESGVFGRWHASPVRGGGRVNKYADVTKHFLNAFIPPPCLTALGVICLFREGEKAGLEPRVKPRFFVDFFSLPTSGGGGLIYRFVDSDSRRFSIWLDLPVGGLELGSVKLSGDRKVMDGVSVDDLGLGNLLTSEWESKGSNLTMGVVDTDNGVNRISVEIEECSDSILKSVIQGLHDSDYLGCLSLLTFRCGVGYSENSGLLENGVAEDFLKAVALHTDFDSYSMTVEWINDFDGDRESLRLSASGDQEFRETLGVLEGLDTDLELTITYGKKGYSVAAWVEDLSIEMGSPINSFLTKYKFGG
jgi:hypothetical protein